MSLSLRRFGYGAAIGETSIRGAVEFAAALGLGACELNLGIPAFFPEEYDAAERATVAAVAMEHCVDITIHAPEDLTFLTLHREVSEAAISRMLEVLCFADDIGARRVTMHLGNTVYFTMPDGRRQFVLDDYAERFGALVVETLGRLARRGSARPLLCVENDAFFAHPRIQQWLQQALDDNPGTLGLTWDLGHSYNSPAQLEFLRRNLHRVANCHVHDHNGRSDHLPPGQGSLDLLSLIRLLEPNDTSFIFEVRPRSAVPQCVDWLRSALSLLR